MAINESWLTKAGGGGWERVSLLPGCWWLSGREITLHFVSLLEHEAIIVESCQTFWPSSWASGSFLPSFPRPRGGILNMGSEGRFSRWRLCSQLVVFWVVCQIESSFYLLLAVEEITKDALPATCISHIKKTGPKRLGSLFLVTQVMFGRRGTPIQSPDSVYNALSSEP